MADESLNRQCLRGANVTLHDHTKQIYGGLFFCFFFIRQTGREKFGSYRQIIRFVFSLPLPTISCNVNAKPMPAHWNISGENEVCA